MFINRLTSSVNKWKSRISEQLLKSLIYTRDNSGPRTKPWGTSQETGWSSDSVFPKEIYW